ncbi:hypothetical protein ABD89_18415 [Lysinibacillus sphaericus]|nr:hypothetical protein [Lysinibacillus sphaericus]
MSIFHKNKKRDIAQEFNSHSISLISKNVDMTTFVATLCMETAGLLGAQPPFVVIAVHIIAFMSLPKRLTTNLTTIH